MSSDEDDGVQRIHIPKWANHRNIPSSIIVLFGKRNSGKTWLVRDLMRSLQGQVDVGLLFSPTLSTHQLFSHFFPSAFMHSEFDERKLEALIQAQKSANRKGKKLRSVIILDDCLYDKKTSSCKSIKELAFNGRHLPATVFITVQYLTSLSPSVRSNADLVFCLKENNMGSRRKLHESFFGCIQHYSSFCSVLDGATKSYSALVYDSVASKTSTNVLGGIYHYKGTLDHVPKLFHPSFWDMQRQYLKDPSDEPTEPSSKKTKAHRKKKKKKSSSAIGKDVTVILQQ